MNKLSILLLALLTLGAWYFTDNDDWKNKVNPELLQQLERGGTQEFIILFQQQADVSHSRILRTKEERGEYVYRRLAEQAARSQKEVIAILENKKAEYRSFFIVNSIYAKGKLALVRQLANQAEVVEIQPNPQVKLSLPEIENEPGNNLGFRNELEWGLEKIGVQQVWDMGYTGQGVVVGGQDTGYEWHHPAIKDKYRGWDGDSADHNYHWHDAIHEINPMHGDSIVDESLNPCGLDSPVPCDDHNHGTHTMGTMVGDLSDEGKHIGVAPDAKWIACRNMERGIGTPASYIECFEWFLAPTDLNGENPDPAMAPHVITNSWSCPEMEGCNPGNFHLMQMAVDNLKASGVVVVVSAGNSGSNCSTVSTPAAIFENSFSVGATEQNDTIAGFSSRGAVMVDSSGRLKPNVAAPGVGVRSCIRNGAYSTSSGTSMAGPHVAGMVALLVSAKPELAGQVEVIESIIEQTAKPMLSEQDCGGFSGMEIPNAVYGYGRVDAPAAVEEALGITTVSKTNVYQRLRVYPNPSNGRFVFEVEAAPDAGILEIYNLNGKRIQELEWESGVKRKTIFLNNWRSGVYFYRYTTPEQQFSGKLSKM